MLVILKRIQLEFIFFFAILVLVYVNGNMAGTFCRSREPQKLWEESPEGDVKMMREITRFVFVGSR